MSVSESRTSACVRLLERVEQRRRQVSTELPARHRKVFGQYMTPGPTARRMARMLRLPKVVRLLDAGAGVGSLTAAVVASACEGRKKPQSIHVVAYEIDEQLAVYLAETLVDCAAACGAVGIAFSSEVRRADFLEDGCAALGGALFAGKQETFNCAIQNPPYRKIRSDSRERMLLRGIGVETSNLYTAFLAVTTRLLARGGQLVAISPRSFCNGLYFRPFREDLLSRMRLDRIHVFESRSSTFEDDGVLQENVIVHATQSTRDRSTVEVSVSPEGESGASITRRVPYANVVDPADPERFIRVAGDDEGGNLQQRMAQLPCTLDELGLCLSTGRVVDFRAVAFIQAQPSPGTVPLIYPEHLSNGGGVEWPLEHGRKPCAILDSADSAYLLVPTGFYVLTKRFTAKEEPRRVVAAFFDPAGLRGARPDRLGFENHTNYYHARGTPLPEKLARGLTAYLNTTFVDGYFRLFSGHTQVNATDLRSLRYPSRQDLEQLGERASGQLAASDVLDGLLWDVLGRRPAGKIPA